MMNYYELLGVAPDADKETIDEAITRENRSWRRKTEAQDIVIRQAAEMRMKHLADAEEILLDDVKRKEYDRKLREQPAPAPERGGARIQGKTCAELIEAGLKLAGAGSYQDALEFATLATEADPTSSAAWALLAEIHKHLNQKNEALYEYNRAMRGDPRNPELPYQVGELLESDDRYDEALKSYQAAESLDPKAVLYASSTAFIYYKQQKFDAAVEKLEKCLKLAPSDGFSSSLLCGALVSRLNDKWFDIPAGNGVPPGLYPLNGAALAESRKTAARIAQLSNLNKDAQSDQRRLERIIQEATQIKFDGSWRIIGGAVAFGALFLLWASGIIKLMAMLWFFGGSAFYYWASRTPVWMKASRIIDASIKRKEAPKPLEEQGCLRILTIPFIPLVGVAVYFRSQKALKEAA
jgi:tetratricopeptide (TPR) repeat protein